MAVCRLGIFGRRSDGCQPLDQIVELLRGAVRNSACRRCGRCCKVTGNRAASRGRARGRPCWRPGARGAGPDALPLVADHRFGLPHVEFPGDHLPGQRRRIWRAEQGSGVTCQLALSSMVRTDAGRPSNRIRLAMWLRLLPRCAPAPPACGQTRRSADGSRPLPRAV